MMHSEEYPQEKTFCADLEVMLVTYKFIRVMNQPSCDSVQYDYY
jgi:hypothetical protein